MDELRLQHVGQIVDARVSFGDLTVLVGPQAAGKSITLQFLKLLVDTAQIHRELAQHGLDWSGKLPEFFDIYFGEGMRALWRSGHSRVSWNGKAIESNRLAGPRKNAAGESLFFIPAQRVLVLRDGWPRPFADYSPGDPFAVREFSDRLRVLVEQQFAGIETLFPQSSRLSKDLQTLLERHLFGNFKLAVDKVRSQKRLVLGTNGESLPYLVWSAGQREFVPLLLGLYWLMPPTKASRRRDTQWVAIEEPEMGLHPHALSVVLLLVFDLLRRGYRVCFSTHSPHLLEALWAVRHLSASSAAPSELLTMFDVPHTPSLRKLAVTAMRKKIKVFYFDRDGGKSTDISDLDPSAGQTAEAGWGGLTEFSERANTIVARALVNSDAAGAT